MEKTDPHKHYSYSRDQILKSAFEMEINTLKLRQDRDNELGLIESYLKERLNEIKERWK